MPACFEGCRRESQGCSKQDGEGPGGDQAGKRFMLLYLEESGVDESKQKIPQRLALVIAIQALQDLPSLNVVFYCSSSGFIQFGIVPSTAL